MAAMPSEPDNTDYVASLASPTLCTPSTGRPGFQSHGKTLSMASEPAFHTRSNRFSLQFPVQPTAPFHPVRAASPTRECVNGTPDIDDPTAGPSDGNFLHLVAAQERRVLELKEELQRAEADLTRLKREWAKHEANKKRGDAKRLTRPQTLQTSPTLTSDRDDEDGSSAWLQQEMERRKALLSASKPSSRTVFPGQRHTRALSLLSPARESVRHSASHSIPMMQPPPRPPRKDSLKNPTRQSMDLVRPSAREHTVPPNGADTESQDKLAAQSVIDQEMLLRAGKKVATDFKDGLWTFWEDLRQATVGEESGPIQPPISRRGSAQTLKAARKQGSIGSLQGSSRSSSTLGIGPDRGDAARPPAPRKKSAPLPDLADPSFWSDHGTTIEPKEQASTKKQAVSRQHKRSADSTKRLSGASNDGWDTWDSPEQSGSSSSVASEAMTLSSTVSGSGSPRTSGSISNRESRDLSGKKEALPWPALKKSGIGSLRRTASHLLSEWEKSLTPSPGEEFTGQEDYLGAGASAAAAEAIAYGAKSSKKD
ncbi:hypothetical protein CLAFUW4_07195 [Fulvia fulva]|uniref:DUF4048 domain-containing protein n=1 Tax=Passalora fulva TaxID=5499 RepID=A0A9Q8UR92_PASFU|nr:uncharacterized protein CLAFUR5_07329 [Fulvia fulva]KAK4621598.1 hypothetical protein CLAFUR4_07203 [Fulvia fulva]UJO19481.1 hypothetical protein CLAFUR5_07329 [Fulvia fulva]WPV16311.1 hypothetical protein CLAFUW4_07195 [Fulvia fulva]WPV31528.1 hypothetical protein CLAFUW7_07196 [Fulvia fulva]